MAAKTVTYFGKKMNTQGAVREVLKRLNKASVRTIRDVLNLTDEAGAVRVYRAINDLRKQGCARRIVDGLYEYQEPTYKAPDMLGKIWRAIRNSRQFTVDDIVLLSSAGQHYISQYIKHLAAEEFLILTGRKQDKKPVYQITAKATPGVPPYSQKKKRPKPKNWTELEEATWAMARLVMTVDKNQIPQIKEVFKELTKVIEKL